MAVFPVVLDANVLYGILPTDLLLTTAGHGLFRPHWTAEILDEARRNILAKQRHLNPAAVDKRFAAMNRARPDGMLDPPALKLVKAMTNDADDRHVLATAVSINAEVVVTDNIKHFKPQACEPVGVKARTLDEFVTDLVSLDHRVVTRAIREMAGRRTRPPTTPAEICTSLQRYIPAALAALLQCASTRDLRV